jgi:hypothetical protein
MSLKTDFFFRVIIALVMCALTSLAISPRVTANQVDAPTRKKPTASAVQRFLEDQGKNTLGWRRGPFDVGGETKRLQVAYVIDNSLDRESLELLRNLLPVFLKEKIRGDIPERAIVGAQDGIYVVNDFRTSDVELEKQLKGVTGGARSNREDFWDGVVKAVTKLNWDSRRDTLRWVVVCGNSVSHSRTATQEESLVRLARAKNISIMSLLFQSSPSASTDSRQRAKKVLTSLSTATAGSFVDLSSQSSIDYWNEKSTPLDKPSPNIETPKDPLTIRVVGPDRASKTLEVMRRVLRQVPCSVVESSDTSKYWIDVTQSNFRGRIKIRASLKYQDVKLASAQMIRLDSWDEFSSQNAAGQCLHELLTSAARTLNDSHLELRERIKGHLDRDRRLRCVVANHPRARDEIMAALKLLRQSHAEDPGEMQQTTKRVMAHLNNADFYDRGNAFALLLMANAQFNLAQAAKESGNQQREELAYRQRYLLYLGRAHQASLDSLPETSPIWKVIEAEYHLGFNEFGKAIELYEQIASIPPLGTTADIELRARWMLCGLYAGDWNIASKAEELVAPSKSLGHMQEILKRWPNSPEAKLLRNEMKKDRFRLPVTNRRYAVTFPSAEMISSNTIGD